MACPPEVQAGSLRDTLWGMVLVALAATEPLPPSEGALLQPGDPGPRILELSSSTKNYNSTSGAIAGRVGADHAQAGLRQARAGAPGRCPGARLVIKGDFREIQGQGGWERVCPHSPLHLSEFNSSFSGQMAQQVPTRSRLRSLLRFCLLT